MRFFLSLIIILFFISSNNTLAQSKKQKKKDKNENIENPFQQQNTSLRPASDQAGKSDQNNLKRVRKPFYSIFKKDLDNKVDQFYERQEQNAKRDKKMRRKMEHPMYSDFSYFGHKKKPKIRPVGKKKFCKECGIKH